MGVKPGPKPKNTVKLRWSTNLAYAIGLLVADGSLSSDGRHIDFTSKDIDLIQTFQECLNISHITIGTKKSGSTNQHLYYRIQFSDISFHQWLQTIGIHPNKSKTISRIKIPEGFFFDFVRGVFDGDGTIYESVDSRWKNSTVISLGFASGSKQFLQWLQASLSKNLLTTGSISQGARVLQLRYGKSDSKKIYDAMYYHPDLPKLHRKFAKIKKILRIDEP